MRVPYWALDGRLEFKYAPRAQHAGLKNEKWVVHRQIIVIVFFILHKTCIILGNHLFKLYKLLSTLKPTLSSSSVIYTRLYKRHDVLDLIRHLSSWRRPLQSWVTAYLPLSQLTQHWVLNFSQWSEIWWTHLKPTETWSEIYPAHESMCFTVGICSSIPKTQTWKSVLCFSTMGTLNTQT